MSFSLFETGYEQPKPLRMNRYSLSNIMSPARSKNILEAGEDLPKARFSDVSFFQKGKSARLKFAQEQDSDPSYFTATKGQRKLLDKVLDPVDLTYQFDGQAPGRIHNEAVSRLPAKALLGKGTFGYVESVSIRSLEARDPALYIDLLKSGEFKNGDHLPKDVARKVFDMKKLLSPEESDSWNAGSDNNVAEALREELFSELSGMRREMKLHHEVRHSKYIVDFLGWHICEERKQIVLYLEACHQSLGTILKSGYKFSVTELQNIAYCVVSGLNDIHNAGIVHLDIKPDNLLVGDDGLVKICDFGVSSKFSSAPKDLRFTPIYVSPELFFMHLQSQEAQTDDSETVISDDSDEQQVENSKTRKVKRELTKLFSKGINGVAKSDIWSLGMCLLDLMFTATPLSYASMSTVRDKLATCIVLADKGIKESFVDLLLEEGQCLRDEGINYYPGEKDSSPRLKYKTGMIDFLDEFENTEAVNERNDIRKLLDFIRKTLIVNVESRYTAEKLLQHQFLNGFDDCFDSLAEGRDNRKEVLHDLLDVLLAEKRRTEHKSYNRRNRTSQRLKILAKTLTQGWMTRFKSISRKKEIQSDLNQIRLMEKKIGVTL